MGGGIDDVIVAIKMDLKSANARNGEMVSGVPDRFVKFLSN
jgi:hypothetical protein